jgi:hypothetical protein
LRKFASSDIAASYGAAGHLYTGIAVKGGECAAERFSAGERIEIVSSLRQAGDHFWCELGAERDDQIVGGKNPAVHGHLTLARIDSLDHVGSRSTSTTRCSFGNALRSSLAATSPPTPPPRIKIFCAIDPSQARSPGQLPIR